jgi:hypothetical protein
MVVAIGEVLEVLEEVAMEPSGQVLNWMRSI